MKSAILSEMCECLNSNATNYTVFLQSYQVTATAGESSGNRVSSALGAEALAVEFQEVTEDEIVAEIQDSLMFSGDTGAGPDAEVIASVEFANCLDELLAEVRKYAKAANKIERFWLKTGHPAYPVFWILPFYSVALMLPLSSSVLHLTDALIGMPYRA